MNHKIPAKFNEVYDYSNPLTVKDKAKELLHNNTLTISARKNKKYMIFDPNTKKWIHFGELPYQDYTKHQDEKRRELFRKRNSRWKNAKPYSAAWLSYNLLW